MDDITKTVEYGGDIYYRNSKRELHNLNGPAIVYADGTKEWFYKGFRHRSNGPAIENANGTKEWFYNGKPHRLDGPAIEYASGNTTWYLNGRYFLKRQHNKISLFSALEPNRIQIHTMDW
jgi:hypothetical protein